MRIWMVNHYAVPPSSGGGTRHYNFARELIRRGHEVTIFAANYSHFSRSYQTGETASVMFDWIDVPPYKGNTLARFWNMLVFACRIRGLKPGSSRPFPDVIIGSSPHLFAAFGAALLARRLRVPYVMEVRDIWPESLVDLGKFTNRHPLIRIMKRMEKYIYRKASKVISLLPAASPYLIKHGVKPGDIVWLPNYVDMRNIDNIPSGQKPLKQKFTVMYAGAHGVANDLDTAIEAALLLQQKDLDKEIQICLMGEGPEKKRLQEKAVALGVRMVNFMEAVPKASVYAVMAEADTFLMLLKKSPVFRWGVSPNKLFDYLLMAKPVIFGVETPVDPVSEAGAGVSVPPSDPMALALAIEQMYQSTPEERAAMGARGRAYVEQHHNVIPLTDKLDKLLKEVVAGGA